MKLGWHIRGCAWCATGVLLAAGCGSLGSNGAGASANGGPEAPTVPGGDFGGGGFGGNASVGNGAAFDAGISNLPPEQETPLTFQLPQAGQNYVYVANPDGDTVAVIDAKTLAIQTVPAGDQPKFLQTLGGVDAAIVLNVGSSDATIIRTANGASTTSTVRVQTGSNAIAVSPDGKHAVAYFNEALSTGTDQPGSFQDLTVIALDASGDHSTAMTVGFQPSNVFFSSDGSTGFVVTQDGVSVLDFADVEKSGPGIARTVPLGTSAADQSALDVSVTLDGKFALARVEGSSVLRLVDLTSGAIQTLDVAKLVPAATAADSGPPNLPAAADGGDAGPRIATEGGAPPPGPATPPAITDVDLAPSGAYAMAVVRDRSAVVRIPIPGAFSDPSVATTTVANGELIGSVTLSPQGHYALLYTTAVDTYKRLTLLDLTGATPLRTIELQKSIDSIAVAPDDATALVVHKKLDGDPAEVGIDLATKLDREYGYSVVALASGFPKLEVTEAPLGPFATVPDGSHLFILFSANNLRQVDDVDLRSLLIDSLSLGSPPVSVGAVPASNRVFVGQDHPDGRISFIDWTTGEIQSVTGFELNSRIRQ